MKTSISKLKIGLIEDDLVTSLALQTKIRTSFPEHKIVFKASSINAAKESLKEHLPNLVIMDVNLDDNKTAFDLLNSLDAIDFNIIFITSIAKDKFSWAFNHYPTINYLIKPINFEILKGAIEKSVLVVNNQKIIADYYNDVNKKNSQPSNALANGKLLFSLTKGRKAIIEIKNIIRFESLGNFSTAVLDGDQVGKKTVIKSLKSCEEDLSIYPFCRVHKKHLINLNHIKMLHYRPVFEIEMSNADRVPLARSKKKLFLEQYAHYQQVGI
ncbi:MAG: LytR/AlgR family response regulator transcription factor [Saprospiraceae bacterium]